MGGVGGDHEKAERAARCLRHRMQSMQVQVMQVQAMGSDALHCLEGSKAGRERLAGICV